MSMEAVQTRPGQFEVEDVEYLRHGDKPLFIRCYRPHGAGPFPVMIELHGGRLEIESEPAPGETYAATRTTLKGSFAAPLRTPSEP